MNNSYILNSKYRNLHELEPDILKAKGQSIIKDFQNFPQLNDNMISLIEKPIDRNIENQYIESLLKISTTLPITKIRIQEIIRFINDIKKLNDSSINMAILFRISLECINRIFLNLNIHTMISNKIEITNILNLIYPYMKSIIYRYSHDIQVIIIAMKLTNDLLPYCYDIPILDILGLLYECMKYNIPIQEEQETITKQELYKEILTKSYKESNDESANDNNNIYGNYAEGNDLSYSNSSFNTISKELINDKSSNCTLLLNPYEGLNNSKVDNNTSSIIIPNISNHSNNHVSPQIQIDSLDVNPEFSRGRGRIGARRFESIQNITSTSINREITTNEIQKNHQDIKASSDDSYQSIANTILNNQSNANAILKNVTETNSSLENNIPSIISNTTGNTNLNLSYSMQCINSNLKETKDNLITISLTSLQHKNIKNKTISIVQPTSKANKRQQTMILLQIFACLYKVICFYNNQNNENGPIINQLHCYICDLSKIILLCNSNPRFLEYYIWIIDILYSKYPHADALGNEVIECFSMTMENLNVISLTPQLPIHLSYTYPSSDIIISVALVACNVYLEHRERELGLKWLFRWNDKTSIFYSLIRKGISYQC